jgi:aminobenzoyl-glutamate utilization protein B
MPGHNWANAIAMATPIAHKGVTAGAQVLAMTMIDLLMKPALVQAARDYFNDEQTRNQQYHPLMSAEEKPAIWLNKRTMDDYRDQMKKFYFDPSKYDTYLEQLGISYPTVRAASTTPAPAEKK